jgi:hypothetical protein
MKVGLPERHEGNSENSVVRLKNQQHGDFLLMPYPLPGVKGNATAPAAAGICRMSDKKIRQI